ncbi:MAG: 3'-5' exonuclease [Inquilinus sp.]|uniref:3'-5' exonuclease n=1 Tax=Inquilinus sp. TaxID=1932117 RepID=UPI003F2ECAF3
MMTSTLSLSLEEMAERLTASGEYRVLRRMKARPDLPCPPGVTLRMGLFVDVETTGLDTAHDEIIELAMMPFRYGSDGVIYSVGEPFHSLREPHRAIPPEVTALTGLDSAAVAGHQIDPDVVASFAGPAALIVAHNAEFDRRMLERFCPTFATRAWACSMTQVDWRAEGAEGRKLKHLAADLGFFFDGHRAVDDCLAAIELLASRLPVSGRTGLDLMLEQARKPSWRIWAEHTPFDLKDLLKARGYRWNPEGNALPRAWYIDVVHEARDVEIAFLCREIYQREIQPLIQKITAYNRFSDRLL